MRIAVVGTGFGRRVVAPAFAATEGCTVADVVSARDADAVGALAGRSDVDLVSIHSPPFLHTMHVRTALAHGKAVLCDKPFTTSSADARALEQDARDAGVVALVNFEFRYEPARRLVRDMVRDGSLGPVEHVAWTHYSAGTRHPLRPYGWLFDPERGGGWIGAWGSHAVDTLRFCFGEVVDAIGFPRTAITERPDADGRMQSCTAEDGLTAVLRLEGGTTVAIDSTFAATATLPPRLTVVGRDATLEVTVGRRIVVRRAGAEPEDVALPETSGADRHEAPMRTWAGVVRDAVDAGAAPPDAPTFADGAACAAVLERLRG